MSSYIIHTYIVYIGKSLEYKNIYENLNKCADERNRE